MRRIAVWLVLSTLIIAMLACAPVVLSSARDGLARFAFSALPSLLPFLIAARLLLASGAAGALGRPLGPVVRWLGLPDAAGGVIAASLLAGYPTGARLTADLAEEGALSDSQARTLAVAASHPGPVFVLGITSSFGAGWGLVLLAACAVGGIVGAKAVSGRRNGGSGIARAHGAPPGKPFSPLDALPGIIRESCLAMLPVCGAMVFFGVIIGLLQHVGAFRLTEGLLPLATPLAIGLLEMVAGCEAALHRADPLVLCGVILAWGGLSILAQSLVFLRPHGVSAGRLMLGKAVQAAVTGGLVLASRLFAQQPDALPAMVGNPVYSPALWWFPPLWLLLCVALCIAAARIAGSHHKRRR